MRWFHLIFGMKPSNLQVNPFAPSSFENCLKPAGIPFLLIDDDWWIYKLQVIILFRSFPHSYWFSSSPLNQFREPICFSTRRGSPQSRSPWCATPSPFPLLKQHLLQHCVATRSHAPRKCWAAGDVSRELAENDRDWGLRYIRFSSFPNWFWKNTIHSTFWGRQEQSI